MVKVFSQNGYIHHSPALRHCHRCAGPFAWQDAHGYCDISQYHRPNCPLYLSCREVIAIRLQRQRVRRGSDAKEERARKICKETTRWLNAYPSGERGPDLGRARKVRVGDRRNLADHQTNGRRTCNDRRSENRRGQSYSCGGNCRKGRDHPGLALRRRAMIWCVGERASSGGMTQQRWSSCGATTDKSTNFQRDLYVTAFRRRCRSAKSVAL